MSLEAAQYVHQLNTSNPSGADRLKDGDDHIRMLKAVLKATFPGIAGPLSSEVTHEFLNGLVGGGTPFGLIAPFYGEAAPAGWALCNGSTVNKSDGSGTFVTPDLRGRTLVGATSTVPLGTAFGQASRTVTSAAGGSHTHIATIASGGGHDHQTSVQGHVLTEAQIPAHRHGTGITDDGVGGIFIRGNKPANGGNISTSGGGGDREAWSETIGGGQAHTHGSVQGSDGAHTHTATLSEAAAHSHSVTVDVTQPSYAINYIIKI